MDFLGNTFFSKRVKRTVYFQVMRGACPRIIRCASRGTVTTYRLRGSRQIWDVRVKTLSIMEFFGNFSRKEVCNGQEEGQGEKDKESQKAEACGDAGQ